MDPLIISILMFVLLFAAIFSGHPLAFSLGGVGTFFLLLVSVYMEGMPIPVTFALYANSVWRIMTDFVLVAIPLFIFMAQIMETCGIAEKLFSALHLILGPIRGGLAISTIMVCTIFAASAGVVGATEVAIGLLAVPALLKRNYSKQLTAGAVCAGGTLGIIIPPSIMLVFYASLANLSPGQLFAAAVVPGMLLALLYMVYIAIRCGFRPDMGPPLERSERQMSVGRKARLLATSLLAPGFLILTVLGTIIAGVATPTEAAGMGCLGALILMAVSRSLTWENVKKACIQTLKTNSMILALAIGGACFQTTFMFLGCGEVISSLLSDMQMHPKLIVLVMMMCVFLLGMFIDWIGILLITVPIFVPVVDQLGFSQVWFATLIAINIQMAFLTPPFGYSLFYLKGITEGKLTIIDIYKGVVPFIIMQWTAMLICFFWEDVILWLPGIIFG
jgi:tripartite ATP-independent transporter DctM subunit